MLKSRMKPRAPASLVDAKVPIVTEKTIEFIRLSYDVDTTVRKVREIEDLDDFLGTRLLDGR